MLRRIAAALAAVAMVAGAGACNRDNAAAELEERNEKIPMNLSLILRGDLDVTIENRKVTTQFVRVGGGPVETMFGIEPLDLIEERGVRVKAGVALIPFRGDGKYTIRPGSPFDIVKDEEEAKKTGKPVEESSVRVEHWPDDEEGFFYVRREKPCTVDVDDDGMKGRLRCPLLTQDGSDKRFSVDFRWEKA